MRWRRTLVWLLAIGAAVLSFDALRAYALGGPALEGGVIPERTVLDREWLAALWALEIDAMAAAGILGIGMNRRDWRAWAMFMLAAVASLGFQVVTPPVELARAVPPVALFLAIVILEIHGGTVAAQESVSREGSTPRLPGQAAGDVPRFGGQPSPPARVDGFVPGIRSGVVGTPPPSIPQTVAANVVGPETGEGGSLPDEPRPVTSVATPATDRDESVTRVPVGVDKKIEAGLYRRQDDPEKFEQYIAAKGLDRDEVMAMAARRGWPVANGHREAMPV